MATLGEAIKRYAEAQGADVPFGATIGESIRAVAVAKGVSPDGTLSEIINEVIDKSEEETDKHYTELATGFFKELSQDAISQYMIENSEAVMEAFGVSKEDGASSIGTAIYDTLQGGETVSVPMNDGGTLEISGHFDEGGEDTWNIQVVYIVPENGTNKCFSEGSKYTVKGGRVTLVANPAEITDTMDYDVALCVYAYTADIEGVEVNNGTESYILDATGLSIAENWDNPCIIDPNGADYTISIHDFRYPEKGDVKVDGNAVDWAEIQKEL